MTLPAKDRFQVGRSIVVCARVRISCAQYIPSFQLLSGAALSTAPTAPLSLPRLTGDDIVSFDPTLPALEPGGSAGPATAAESVFVVEQPGKPSVGPGQVALLEQLLDGGDPELGRELESFRSSEFRLSNACCPRFRDIRDGRSPFWLFFS